MSTFKELFSPEFLEDTAAVFRKVYPDFDGARFVERVQDGEWEQEEFKQRIRHIARALTEVLPPSYPEALDILCAAAPDCRGVEYIFFPDFVELNGLEYEELSLEALKQLTRYSTSEFAIRALIRRNPKGVMSRMRVWATDSCEHVRRLASEGCRPRLPWGGQLKEFIADPAPVIELLELLKSDPSLYVRKSVANNLNDIAKDHPDLVADIARAWKGENPHTNWIVRHGCRTLLKKGDPQVLKLFGLQSAEGVEIRDLHLARPSITEGEELEFSFTVFNPAGEPLLLRIEYDILYMKANGIPAPKRFKLSEKAYPPGISLVTRRHAIRPITTRKHYPGTHGLDMIVNGVKQASAEFELVIPTMDK
ncbi:DNA alkylation repair protein [Paenibacillus sp. P96]|uniref:DNA alkylation repair protein n=1 Tax=Paenibacillus zeirhizosphaerae TaxID=2987519 RepID=A0ABT9FND6_9BACL|nr:DNA alkylation repair protein [Paenibacillus sp. P96]MDP4096246.1 DNA alkylation repair protein [Paenibacillus sp. P96]